MIADGLQAVAGGVPASEQLWLVALSSALPPGGVETIDQLNDSAMSKSRVGQALMLSNAVAIAVIESKANVFTDPPPAINGTGGCEPQAETTTGWMMGAEERPWPLVTVSETW